MNVPLPITSALSGLAIPVPTSLYNDHRPDTQLFPLARPNGPRLSCNLEELAQIEDSFRLSNYGPVNCKFEQEVKDRVFRGLGSCLTVCNATIGLILALKGLTDPKRGGYVLMPSFTFAAAAHAVIWAGYTPLLVDIDEGTWTMDEGQERELLDLYRSEIVAVMPYATFGSDLDLRRYDRIADEFNLPIVIDAAASLGTLSADGTAFGTNSRHAIVFSMHATKAFAVGEGGLVYSADNAAIDKLRCMGNFGFDGSRSAIMPGFNSKISEVAALAALVKLRDYETHAWHRMHLADVYRQTLSSFQHQEMMGSRVAYQFMPVLLPKGMGGKRDEIVEAASARGITLGKYFSPHILEQPYFRSLCKSGELLVTQDIAARALSLPVSDFMTVDDAYRIARVLEELVAHF